ncbi:MAG: NAD(P)H-binding protein [Steroidobacteraceae bacterium]
MIIAIVGATGNLGKELIKEGLLRGHTLRAIAPHADTADCDVRVERFKGSDRDTTVLLQAFHAADAIITIFPARLAHPETYADEIRNILYAAQRAGVQRVIGLVGSSGAKVSTGKHLVDTDYFQETTRHYYQNVHASWDAYRENTTLDWTAVVPAARMQIHMKSHGTYRTRTDEHLVVTDLASRRYFDVSQISYADCARALLDELHTRDHIRQFVSVGY